MGSQPVRLAISLFMGAALGSTVTFFYSHRNARSLQALALSKAPRGFLVAESKLPGKQTLTIDLAHSFGTNPGDPLRYYSGSAYAAPIGSLSFSYPTMNAPGMGDIILFRLLTADGATRNFVVTNGAFGVVFESNDLLVSYAQNKNDRTLGT